MNTIIFSKNQYSCFFLDLGLNIFGEYSYFSRNALLLAVLEKFHAVKSCISNKIKHNRTKSFLLENKMILLK